MKQIEDESANEAGKDTSTKEAQTFDDIYVPGIGVRAALDDDGPAGPGFWSEVAQRRIRAAAFLNRGTSRLKENVFGVGTRLASTLRTAGARLRTVRNLSVSTELATSAASRKLRIVAARSLVVMRSVRVPVRRGSKYRLRLPSIPPTAAIGRNLRRAQSSLRGALAGAGNRLRPVADYMADYKVPLRFNATYRLDRLSLRRALPPLAVLAVIVMFVIEEIATVVRR